MQAYIHYMVEREDSSCILDEDYTSVRVLLADTHLLLECRSVLHRVHNGVRNAGVQLSDSPLGIQTQRIHTTVDRYNEPLDRFHVPGPCEVQFGCWLCQTTSAIRLYIFSSDFRFVPSENDILFVDFFLRLFSSLFTFNNNIRPATKVLIWIFMIKSFYMNVICVVCVT